MASLRGRSPLTVLVLAVAVATLVPLCLSPAQETPAKLPRADEASDKSLPSHPVGIAPDKPLPTTVPLEALPLPPGAILVLYKDVRDALRLMPDALLLKPQKYQELLEEIERLRRQLQPEKPESPSVCRLTGTVAGDMVRLQARFEFKTTRPGTLVNLGCQRAGPTTATFADGRRAFLLPPQDDGFLVQIDRPGEYCLTLELTTPLTSRGKGSDRSFVLDLPRAAITTLDRLDLPAVINRATVTVGQASSLPGRQVACPSGRLEAVDLGPTDRVEVSWKAPAPERGQVPPLLSAEARVTVRIEEAYLLTDVLLDLQVLSGETAQWRVQLPLPPGAMLEVTQPSPQDERLLGIDRPSELNPILTVRLKEPSADPLRLAFQIRQPRQGSAIAVGRFLVLDAARQRGQVEVRAARGDLRLRCKAGAGVTQQEVGEPQRLRDNTVAAFSYWRPPAGAEPVPDLEAPLTLEVETVKGVVETRLGHQLNWTPAGWRLTTTLHVTPHRTAVDRLEVQLPADFEYDRDTFAGPAELVEEVVVEPRTRVADVRLASRQGKPFQVTLTGLYPQAVDHHEASLDLPRPAPSAAVPFVDRGARVTVAVPEGQEVQLLQAPLAAAGSGPRTEVVWQTEQAPSKVDLAWRRYLPDMPVQSDVYISLAPRLATVQHHLTFQFPQQPPAQLRLLVSPGIGRVQQIQDDEAPITLEVRPGGELLVPPGKGTGRSYVLKLLYHVALPLRQAENLPQRTESPPHTLVTVPLIQPLQATSGETRVRVRADASVQLLLAGPPWEELPAERVAAWDSLPALVARAGLNVPLALRLTHTEAAPLASAIVDRVLIRAAVAEDGYHVYRTRFLITKLNARELEIELPVPLARAHLGIRLDGLRPQTRFVDEAGREVDTSRLVRLRLDPDLYTRPVVLEVVYRIDSARWTGNEGMRLLLRPPQLARGVLLGRVRWQVELPPGRMPLHVGEGATIEQRWGWIGWLAGPKPNGGRDNLERWLSSAPPESVPDEGEPSLICWQTATQPLPIIHVPQQTWLLLCSLTLLAGGLALAFLLLPRLAVAAILLLLALPFGLVGTLWPASLPMLLYGCEPGLAVLLLVLGVQALLHWRHRRKVVFMPGFTRLKQDSSPTPSSARGRGEPSTVDEPPRRGSSVLPAPQA